MKNIWVIPIDIFRTERPLLDMIISFLRREEEKINQAAEAMADRLTYFTYGVERQANNANEQVSQHC